MQGPERYDAPRSASAVRDRDVVQRAPLQHPGGHQHGRREDVGGAGVRRRGDHTAEDRPDGHTSHAEHPPHGHDPTEQRLGQDLREGFRYLWDHPFLRAMALAVALTNVAFSTGGAVLVILVVQEIGAPEAAFGLVLAAGAVVSRHRRVLPAVDGGRGPVPRR